MSTVQRDSWRDWLKGGIAGFAYPFGLVLGGMVVAAARLPAPPTPPSGPDPSRVFRGVVISSVLLGLALVPLARGLEGKLRTRWLVLTTFIYVCLGVNTLIEAMRFTIMFEHGGMSSTALVVLPAALLCGLAVALVISPANNVPDGAGEPRAFERIGGRGAWLVRLVLAFMAFPFAYFLFGMSIAPIVKPIYDAGVAGLVIPPLGVIARTQLVRSALFLVACVPVIMSWRGTRMQLFVALGLAQWVTVGLFGLVQAFWMPMLLRVVHTIEVGADSFLYSAALVWLLAREPRATAVVAAMAVTKG